MDVPEVAANETVQSEHNYAKIPGESAAKKLESKCY